MDPALALLITVTVVGVLCLIALVALLVLAGTLASRVTQVLQSPAYLAQLVMGLLGKGSATLAGAGSP